MRALAPHWGALLALALFMAAGLAVLDDYGVHVDERPNALRAERNYAFLIGEDDLFTSAEFYVRLYGPTFDLSLLFVERTFAIDDNPRAIHLSRHLTTHLFYLAGGLFTYLLALRLFGSRLLAVGAMLLFLLHPRLYANSFFNPKDISFLAMLVIALFLTHRAFKRDTLPVFILLGVAVGALVNLRIMGLVLVAAIPAMRALDFAFAQGWAERKRVFLTTGGFALAAALTIYALLPYLWADPIQRAMEVWAILSNHPTVLIEPFRGTLYSSVDAPVEYLPVWFSITAPPFALLLGVVGAAGILVKAAQAPRKALRSEGLRFGLLTIVCFALPVFAVMLPGGNIYDDWRQMYFLWATFSLLATFGLDAIVSAFGRRRLRAAAYGAMSAGLAALVVSMALLHPNQQEHFNFLVDRVTPEHLRTQYAMDHWGHPLRQGLEWLSSIRRNLWADHPPLTASRSADPLVVANALVLPKSERERLANASPFDMIPGFLSWSRSARELHRVKVYGNTLRTIESRDDLREVYEAVHRREPLVAGAFDVHPIDGAFALVMEPCAPSFIKRVSVILRAFPVDAADLPPWREGKAFEPRYFDLWNYGAYFEGKCAASLPLPAYPFADFELRWSPELLDEADARGRARQARENGRLLTRAAHRAAYDVYLADGELAYLNDTCDPPETERQFHLNVYPERVGDLPEERQGRGFERFHFEFLANGAFADGGCAAFFPLPEYPVAGVRTGQYDGEGGNLWFAEFLIDPGRRWTEASAGVSGEPVARGVFDVHLADGALVYVKEPCEPADTEARFFLHIAPERVGDLPAARKPYGFDNLDFAFFPNGALFEGKCAARAALPDFPISSIRTGQYTGGGGAIWSAEFAVEK